MVGFEFRTQTEKELADLDAIAALKETTSLELKDQGNEYVKKGKKHYRDALDCYTRAINQEGLGESEMSILFSNRAHVNLLLGNNRRALEDAEHAIELSHTNIKAFYRAAKASFSLDLLKEVISYCEQGLVLSPENNELNKLVKLASAKLAEHEKHEAEVSKALRGAKRAENRQAMYRELIGLKKPIIDKSKILHWPVLLLYPEVMSSDIIEDFCANSSKWVRIYEKKTLYDVLKEPNLVIPGIPVFYVVSKNSTFYNNLKPANGLLRSWQVKIVPELDPLLFNDTFL
ncbi:Tetratricopeptide repeat protein 4-like protein [Bienertia sinuspersici]